MGEVGNFQENIHKADYLSPYAEKRITSETLVTGGNRPSELLDGEWNYAIDQYDTCLRAKWYQEEYADADGRPFPLDFSFDRWPSIRVPMCWNMADPRFFLYEGSVVYTRVFRYAPRGEGRVFLRFGAAAQTAYVFLNKRYLGVHYGGSTPFCVEATDLLTEYNRLVVVVNNTRRPDLIPADNTDWFNYGGLYRSVELLRLPAEHVRSAKVYYKEGKINAAADLTDGGTARIEIPELGIDAAIPAAIPAAPELWSPERPRLYDVKITYGGDIWTERIGFRDIAVNGHKILLNGEEIFLSGVCAHEESVVNGKAVTEDEIRENFRLAKEMNCRFMRLAHYPHTELAARIADEVGLLLWEEIPVYWAIDFAAPKTLADAKNQLTELIVRDFNRASVIIWSVGNENADTDERLAFMTALARLARSLDPSRLRSAACLVDHHKLIITDRLANELDIIGINEYYGWYEPDFSKLPKIFENSRPAKPVVISEFGADARSGSRGTVDDLYTEDHQAEVYRKQIETLRAIPYVRGIAPWILFEFRCPRRLHYTQNGYNLKGLLSADKTRKKPSYYLMRKFYEEIG
ncbi:MAG: glycoside hydrolase family 2 [Clostridiales bacterium]|jgi:beta-glucuronidase|nr:glycoside hydrolase family 2 [Clostridiales bacterium]